MPSFQVILQLDDGEKETLAAAADSRTFDAALKAHGTHMRAHAKTVAALTKGSVSGEDLEEAQRALTEQRELLKPMADSDQKTAAEEALELATATVEEIARVVAEHRG